MTAQLNTASAEAAIIKFAVELGDMFLQSVRSGADELGCTRATTYLAFRVAAIMLSAATVEPLRGLSQEELDDLNRATEARLMDLGITK